MALRSKNFMFKRKNKDGQDFDYLESDTWYPSNMDYKWNEASLPLPAGGYYGSTNGLHTIAFVLRKFVGRIYVQATLASNPTEDDWFNIRFHCTCEDYMEFSEQLVYNPNRDTTMRETGTTKTISNSVVGNFTYLRLVIDRDYITDNPDDVQKAYAGKLEEVLINF